MGQAQFVTERFEQLHECCGFRTRGPFEPCHVLVHRRAAARRLIREHRAAGHEGSIAYRLSHGKRDRRHIRFAGTGTWEQLGNNNSQTPGKTG